MSQIYYPDRENWVRKDPQSLQINNNLLLKAIEYSKENENKLSIEKVFYFKRVKFEFTTRVIESKIIEYLLHLIELILSLSIHLSLQYMRYL